MGMIRSGCELILSFTLAKPHCTSMVTALEPFLPLPCTTEQDSVSLPGKCGLDLDIRLVSTGRCCQARRSQNQLE